jgi:hypothetical protein
MTPKAFWIGFVIFLLSISVGIQALGLVLANSSPSFALEPDYEHKARHWADHQAQLAQNQLLGWQVEPRFSVSGSGRVNLQLELNDAAGQALGAGKLTARAFHNARASEVQELRFVESEAGLYSAELWVPRAGLWIFELEARVDAQLFTATWRSSLANPVGNGNSKASGEHP